MKAYRSLVQAAGACQFNADHSNDPRMPVWVIEAQGRVGAGITQALTVVICDACMDTLFRLSGRAYTDPAGVFPCWRCGNNEARHGLTVQIRMPAGLKKPLAVWQLHVRLCPRCGEDFMNGAGVHPEDRP